MHRLILRTKLGSTIAHSALPPNFEFTHQCVLKTNMQCLLWSRGEPPEKPVWEDFSSPSPPGYHSSSLITGSYHSWTSSTT